MSLTGADHPTWVTPAHLAAADDRCMADPHSQPPGSYEIRVRGHLGPTLLHAFDGLQAETRGGDTILTGALPDQAALHGVLTRVEALGIELLELRRLPSSEPSQITNRGWCRLTQTAASLHPEDGNQGA
jgi:hypothetical protein